VAKLNDEIHTKVQFNQWWCGHYHDDVCHFSRNPAHAYRYLYRTVNILDKIDDKLVVLD